MDKRQEAEVCRDIENLLAQADIACEPCGRGSLIVGKFQAAVSRAPAVLQQAGIPFEDMRGGYLVCGYDIGQMAKQGWRPPQLS
ncbi:MAG: hypothetical protein NDJ24_00435 [Alphaproteobacteria bacterium]|nr:hypothetical protein [Alphaproteobacteria bacterium]